MKMSIKASAEYLGIPEKTFRDWRLKGMIPIQASNPAGRRVLYDKADLDRWWESKKEPRRA